MRMTLKEAVGLTHGAGARMAGLRPGDRSGALPRDVQRTIDSIVWDMTVGAGNDDETMSPEDWQDIEAELNRKHGISQLTPQIEQAVKRAWQRNLIDMASP